MNAYKVTGTNPANSKSVRQIVTAKADIAKAKNRLNVVFGARKAEMQVELVEIPTTKKELVVFINDLIKEAQA
jgi:hypothetical protein